MPGVTVAEEGNKRRGVMSPDEVRQCVMDIQGWFRRHGATDITGATSVDFQRLSKGVDAPIPDNLEILLGEINGGIWFMDKKALTAEEIMETASSCESSGKWKRGLVPFAGEADGMLVIDTKTDEVVEWDEDDGLGDVVSSTFEDYLENFRNVIVAGKCEFDSDIGVIESVAGGSRK